MVWDEKIGGWSTVAGDLSDNLRELNWWLNVDDVMIDIQWVIWSC